MGRYYWDKKNTVEHCRSISVAHLRQQGFFCGLKSGRVVWSQDEVEIAAVSITVSVMEGEKLVTFRYRPTDPNLTGEACDYKVWLATTPCHFGGLRYWFFCPLNTQGNYCG